MKEYWLKNNDLLSCLATFIGIAFVLAFQYRREKRKNVDLQREIAALRKEPKS